jgi:hypothetical protein
VVGRPRSPSEPILQAKTCAAKICALLVIDAAEHHFYRSWRTDLSKALALDTRRTLLSSTVVVEQAPKP